MKRPHRIVTEQAQTFSFTRRALVLGGVQVAFGAVLGGRMAWLSIAENERYRLLAEDNRVQLRLVPPRRGWIVDRHGKPLAINRIDFRVDLIPDQLPQDREPTLRALQTLLGLPEDEVVRIREDLGKAAGFQPVPVAEKVPYERYAAVSVRLPDLPGVAPQRGYSRFYPSGAAVGHLVGYVGAASGEDYAKTHDPLLVTPGFKIGKEGLEKVAEKILRGTPGAARSEVTARGKVVRDLDTRSDTPGRTLHLTVDAGLHAFASRRIGPESGSCVVIDCTSGDILAMASMPSYDPNRFTDGISHGEWQMLSDDDHHPLLNKTVQALYPPGSTVKPMNALALLEAGVSPNATVTCRGAYRVGSGLFHCHLKRGHGPIAMAHAIEQSCDIYFYTMMRQLGIARTAAMARRLGLGASFPLPVRSQRYGTVPDAEWKAHKYHDDWTIADTVNASIGQGYMLVNPLQLGTMAARIASGRSLVPRLLRARDPAAPVPLEVDPEHLALVHRAMAGVVSPAGTANSARMRLADVSMAGKTGSAQVRRISMADRRAGRTASEGNAWRFRDHGLFVGFAPTRQPRYAAAVVLEHANHGAAAAQVARDVLTYMFDPALAMKTLEAFEAQWGGDIETRMASQAAAWRAEHTAVPTPAGPQPGIVPPLAEDPAPTNAAAEPPDDTDDAQGNIA